MMCLASKYINQLEGTLVGIKTDMKKLHEKLTEYNKSINEIYHDIEVSNFNACEGFYFSKSLQEILQKRRLVKTELFRLEQLHRALSRSVEDRVMNAKKKVEKSMNHSQEWFEKFNFTFSDIEEEILH
ncbi:hypothetical protein [Robertmurraya siralis]|uniref:hypothetical protein n=1 Tax=Robertmurraya siralis TaxID=77777 RepID=UPI0010F9ABB5|nr:hypothetical protein [Robertmurraya siralis]